MADGEIRGSRWRVQYGEIADREQFRIGYIGSEAWDAYFPIASLADITAVLQGAVALSPGQFSRGTNYQTEKVNDWQQTVSIEPLSYTPTPPLMSLYSADLAELISLLQSLATELSGMEPNDWDDSSPKPIPEWLLPDYLQEAALDAKYGGGGTSARILYNVKDYGAVGNNASNDTEEIQACIDACEAAGGGIVFFPYGTYRVNGQLNISKNVSFLGATKKTSLWFYAGSGSSLYGINVEGPGLGGANQDGFALHNLSLKGNAKALLRVYGVGLFRAGDIIVQNSQCPSILIDTCQDAAIGNIDVFSAGILDAVGTAGAGDPFGSILYIKDCNQFYVNYFRAESPRTTAIYAKDSSNIKILEGKVDGSGSSTPSNDPFVVSDSSGLLLQNFSLHGFSDIPCEIRGTGVLTLDNTVISNGTANACVRAVTASQVVQPFGMLPGQKATPAITFRDCSVRAQSYNDSGRNIQALVYSKAPDPLHRPYGEVAPLRVVSAATASGSAYREVTLHYSTDGVNYQAPPNNDKWTGVWLTHRTTGKKARIFQNFSTGQCRLDMLVQTPWQTAVAGDFPVGDFYQLEVNADDGVQVEVYNTKLVYRTRVSVTSFSLAFHVATVATHASTTPAFANGQTTVTLSAAADSSWVGMYLYRVSTNKYYLIREVSGSTVKVDYDKTADFPVNTTDWAIRAGKVRGEVTFDGGKLVGA